MNSHSAKKKSNQIKIENIFNNIKSDFILRKILDNLERKNIIKI